MTTEQDYDQLSLEEKLAFCKGEILHYRHHLAMNLALGFSYDAHKANIRLNYYTTQLFEVADQLLRPRNKKIDAILASDTDYELLAQERDACYHELYEFIEELKKESILSYERMVDEQEDYALFCPEQRQDALEEEATMEWRDTMFHYDLED